MLSVKTENAIKRMILYSTGAKSKFETEIAWSYLPFFVNTTKEDIISDFETAKKHGKLKQAGPKVLAEILELWTLLNRIW